MKKKSEKKLSLGKIKIASLSRDNQQAMYGGRPNLSRTRCDAGGACPSPQTSNCTTHYVICGC